MHTQDLTVGKLANVQPSDDTNDVSHRAMPAVGGEALNCAKARRGGLNPMVAKLSSADGVSNRTIPSTSIDEEMWGNVRDAKEELKFAKSGVDDGLPKRRAP